MTAKAALLLDPSCFPYAVILSAAKDPYLVRTGFLVASLLGMTVVKRR
jgi:hypothetical protein